MDDLFSTREVVSDLVDGRLRDRAFSDAVREVVTNEQAREAWHTYHLVGDVLRGGDLASCADDVLFVKRLQQRLQTEEPVFPADAGDRRGPLPDSVALPGAASARAANDARFAWKLATGFASLLAVAAVGWNMLGDIQGKGWAPPLADARPGLSNPGLIESTREGQVMIRDPRLDHLFMAHRQSGGTSALQVPSGFLRNATFEVPGRQGVQK